MSERLRTFVEEHPSGWDHASWLNLLSTLESEGADVSDPDGIGASLERARLAETLRSKGLKGLGPKRLEAVVERFQTLWNLQHASADDIAEIRTVPADLAERVHQAVH